MNVHTEMGDAAALPTPPPPRTESELRGRRRRITRGLLGGLVALGGVAYVPSVWAAAQVGAWGILAMDTAVYAAIVVVFLRRDLDPRVQGATVVGAAAVLGVALSVVFGPNGAGALWICAAPVLTALLFGRRATLWSVVSLAIALAVIAALRAAGLLAWELTPGGTLLWLVIAGNAVVISGALALGVATLIAGLTEAAARTERYGAALAREQAELLEVNDRLERVIAERARAEARLRQTEKLTAIGTLASGIAHDMNNLLVPILAGTELLREEERLEAGDGERAELLDRTLTAAHTARDLVQRILAFSQPTGEPRRAVYAAGVFREAARLVQATLPANVALAFRADPDAGRVVLGSGEAHQLVLNLGSNAAQAMPDGGQLTIAVDSVPANTRPPDVPAPVTGRFVRLMVSDTGEGMDEETLSRVFEPFFTTRPRGSEAGHGIGLATVYGIATRAGGYVAPHSVPGAGTVMEVFLPRATIGEPETPAADRRPSGRGERVLVVDDDPSARRLASRILERLGYRPVEADGAAAALSALAGDVGFDAVLSDFAMPEQDGLELVARLRESDPSLPVVLMSGLVDKTLRERAREHGIAGVLTKPFELAEMGAAMAAALGRQPAHN